MPDDLLDVQKRKMFEEKVVAREIYVLFQLHLDVDCSNLTYTSTVSPGQYFIGIYAKN